MEPHRPFVPHRSPAKPQPAISSADFAVMRPFIPGADRQHAHSFRDSNAAISNEAISNEPTETEEEALPPVEHFLDTLPSVAEFEAAEVVDESETMDLDSFAAPSDPAEGWGETDWQQYDWRSVAALGDTSETASEASNAWATTDWDAEVPRHKKSPAQDIASALDQIAQRIRDGELPLPLPGVVSDPATIAATLAALLGIRR